jgi:hypothetical protein
MRRDGPGRTSRHHQRALRVLGAITDRARTTPAVPLGDMGGDHIHLVAVDDHAGGAPLVRLVIDEPPSTALLSPPPDVGPTAAPAGVRILAAASAVVAAAGVAASILAR